MSKTEPSSSARGTLLGPSRFLDPSTGAFVQFVDISNLETASLRRIAIGFFGHGISVDPVRPQRAVVFEKRGPGGCEVDLVAGKMLRVIAPGRGRHFYGHAAFTADAKRLFVVESDPATGDGVISIRDATTFAELGEFPTYGGLPHDCVLIDDGRTLVITNGGGPLGGQALPSVTFVDVATQKLVERIRFDNQRVNAGHLALTTTRDLAVVSAPRDGLPELTTRGGLALRTAGGVFREVSEPREVLRRMLGESLSVAIHEPTRVVAVTNPHGNVLTFWELDTGRLVKCLDLDAPRGVTVTLDGAWFAVAHGATGRLAFFEAATLEPAPPREGLPPQLSGSHLFVWREAERFHRTVG